MRFFKDGVTHMIDDNVYIDTVGEWETKQTRRVLPFAEFSIDELP